MFSGSIRRKIHGGGDHLPFRNDGRILRPPEMTGAGAGKMGRCVTCSGSCPPMSRQGRRYRFTGSGDPLHQHHLPRVLPQGRDRPEGSHQALQEPEPVSNAAGGSEQAHVRFRDSTGGPGIPEVYRDFRNYAVSAAAECIRIYFTGYTRGMGCNGTGSPGAW